MSIDWNWDELAAHLPDGLEPLPVFLAKRDSQTSDLEQLLLQAHIKYLPTSEYGGGSVSELHRQLGQCGAVVAYLGSLRPPTGVILEIGAGLGRGLPVVVVLGAKVKASGLPAALRELPSMRLPAEPSLESADRLRSLLRTAAELMSFQLRDSQLARPKAAGRTKWADSSEQLVAETLQRLGGRVVGFEPSNSIGNPDLAVWIPSLPGAPFNPLIVEVTGMRPDLKAKELQLRQYLRRVDGLLGLLVVPDLRESSWRVQSNLAILTIGSGTLRDLSPEEFERIIRNGRNRLFHAP